jgi:hypothetical protein
MGEMAIGPTRFKGVPIILFARNSAKNVLSDGAKNISGPEPRAIDRPED